MKSNHTLLEIYQNVNICDPWGNLKWIIRDSSGKQKRSIRDSLGKSKKVGKNIQALMGNKEVRAICALLRS